MAAVLRNWREAATLILVSAKHSLKNVKFTPVSSNKGSGPSAENKGSNFDVLMLKRSSKSTFMPNVYVFPGGVASDADFSKDWLELFTNSGDEVKLNLFKFVKGNSPGAPMFSRNRDPEFSSIPSEIAFRICAIRETFEESGVLLARNASNLKTTVLFNADGPVYGNVKSSSDIQVWRKRIEDDAGQFITMCKELGIVPDVWSLYEWSNWLTPAKPIHYQARNPRRYDTAFFLCCVDDSPDAVEDQGETVHSQWGSPFNILLEFTKGWAGIESPQMYELSRLLNFNSAAELHQFAWKRSKERIQRFLSVRYKCADAMLNLLPGDQLYPEEPDLHGEDEVLSSTLTREDLEKKYPRQHRTWFYEDEKDQRKRYIQCNIEMKANHVAPVNFTPESNPFTLDSKL